MQQSQPMITYGFRIAQSVFINQLFLAVINRPSSVTDHRLVSILKEGDTNDKYVLAVGNQLS